MLGTAATRSPPLVPSASLPLRLMARAGGLAQSTLDRVLICAMLASRVSPAGILGPVLPHATSVACPDRYRVRQLRAGPQKLLSACCRPHGLAGRPRLAPRRGLQRAGLRVDAASSARRVAGTRPGWMGWSLRHAGPIAWPLGARTVASAQGRAVGGCAGTRIHDQATMAARRPGADSGLTSAGARRRQVSAPGTLGAPRVQRTACAGFCRRILVSRNRACFRPKCCSVAATWPRCGRL